MWLGREIYGKGETDKRCRGGRRDVETADSTLLRPPVCSADGPGHRTRKQVQRLGRTREGETRD